MKVFLAHASDFDFRNKLYIPIRHSPLNSEFEFFFPQESEKEEVTKELIKGMNLLLVDVSRPSTGAGIEMGWADAFSIPIIAMHEKGSSVSSSVDYVAKERIEYLGPEEIIEKLTHVLHGL